MYFSTTVFFERHGVTSFGSGIPGGFPPGFQRPVSQVCLGGEKMAGFTMKQGDFTTVDGRNPKTTTWDVYKTLGNGGIYYL